MTNPYRPPTDDALVVPQPTSRVRYPLAAFAMLGGLYVAASGINRFINYGGFELIAAMSASERGSAALWALTHLTGFAAAFITGVGFIRSDRRWVFLGIACFVVVCVYSWARPMDFLWFGGIQ